MAFYRTKRANGREYRQLVENYRDEDGKHRQRVLAHLGDFESVEEAAEHFELVAARERELQAREESVRDRYLGPGRKPVWTAARAAECERRAARYEDKAATLRQLLADGKAAPDSTEEREAREEERRAYAERVRAWR